MSDGTEKVCPNCGNEFFYREQSLIRRVLVDGDSQIADIGLVRTQSFIGNMKCTHCEMTYESPEELVTAEYFHEVIATQEGE